MWLPCHPPHCRDLSFIGPGKSLPEPAPAAFSPSVAPNPVELLLPWGPLALRRPLGDSACYWAERREAGKVEGLVDLLTGQPVLRD